MAYKFILSQIDNLYNGLLASDMLMFKDMGKKQQYTESCVTFNKVLNFMETKQLYTDF